MKKVYNSPVVETLVCQVEKGFAVSAPLSSVNPDNGGSRLTTALDHQNANDMFGD